ncbi:hypothetical protein AVL48_37375 [Amycolatopsis regifaucium]|uniref:Uncharacterized protein n=1 Tax=Amycolatopsis regifaucium TaxID=546365 RepID=A0A154ME44_9PSEU|nr:hypothetical protein AVL48_37375 [Amycolatopsis regifaucium]
MFGNAAKDHVVVFDQVDVRGRGQMRVPEDRLNVTHRQPDITRHANPRSVAQVVRGPIRPQRGVQPTKHRAVGLVVQRLPPKAIAAIPTAQRLPHRIARREVTEFGDVEPQPDERLGADWKPLLGSASFPDDTDQLLAPVQIHTPYAQQFTRPCPAADRHRHDRAIPIRP